MLSMARAVPQANTSTKSGKWEKKKFLGNELRGKTLGVVGLGSIGREVVKRAKPFEMRIIGHDPYVSAQSANAAGVELVSLAELYAQAGRWDDVSTDAGAVWSIVRRTLAEHKVVLPEG